jgi:hypothetical protein
MDKNESETARRRAILGETAKIPWRELQRWFANGTAIFVSPELDLVDVAWQVSQDGTTQVKAWLDQDRLGPVTDAQALDWFAADALMWAVVVKPYVLVQPANQALP